MRAIVVDDEMPMLETLEEAVKSSRDIRTVTAFSSCSAALAHADSAAVDIAFLDINMRGMGGIALAKALMERQPRCKIVFCTGYEEYAVQAFQMHASGYLMKPITPEAVQREIDHIRGVTTDEKVLTIKCFGNFEVLHAGEILPFKRTKTKELLAVLVDRNGAGMTAKQICALLFPDDTDDSRNTAYLRQLMLDLRQALKSCGAAEVLQHETPFYRINTNLVKCDYLEYLETGRPEFRGEYMTQYSWAEETCAMLQMNHYPGDWQLR